MVEHPAKFDLRIFASLPYDCSPRELWPELIARAHRFGVEAIVIRPLWAWHAILPNHTDLHGQSNASRDLVGLIRLCHAAGLTLALDLGGFDAPPLHLLRSHAPITHAEPSGALRIQPLHPALMAETQQWIAQLSAVCVPFQQPDGPLVALFATNLAPAAIAILQEWLQSNGWKIPLFQTVAPIDLAIGWPFEQAVLHTGDLDTFFRNDGSATLRLWDLKPFAALVRSTASDVYTAQPPAGPQGMRDAWADASDIDIHVRHGNHVTYLAVHNRRTEPYSGMLTYRNRDGELLHLHTNLGPQRQGVVLLHGEEIAGVAFTGDASEGVWLVRAMRSSIVFNGGAGGVVPSGRGVLLMAAQSGRFQLRRMEGWADMHAYRLTMRGQLLPCPCQIEAQHLTVPYIIEDQHGQTDRYIILSHSDPLPEAVETHLQILLRMRAAELDSVALICRNDTNQQLASAADLLESTALGMFDVNDYRRMWASTEQIVAHVYQQLEHERIRLQYMRQMRGEEPAGEDEAWRIQVLAALQRLLRSQVHD